jgi:hypothetical protein
MDVFEKALSQAIALHRSDRKMRGAIALPMNEWIVCFLLIWLFSGFWCLTLIADEDYKIGRSRLFESGLAVGSCCFDCRSRLGIPQSVSRYSGDSVMGWSCVLAPFLSVSGFIGLWIVVGSSINFVNL